MTTWAEDFEEAANGETIHYAVLSPIVQHSRHRSTTEEVYQPIPWQEARTKLVHAARPNYGVYAWTDNYILAIVGAIGYGYEYYVERFPRNIVPCAVSLWME